MATPSLSPRLAELEDTEEVLYSHRVLAEEMLLRVPWISSIPMCETTGEKNGKERNIFGGGDHEAGKLAPLRPTMNPDIYIYIYIYIYSESLFLRNKIKHIWKL